MPSRSGLALAGRGVDHLGRALAVPGVLKYFLAMAIEKRRAGYA
jgi:hypothetical protein